MIIDIHAHCLRQDGGDNWPLLARERRKNAVSLVLLSALGDWSPYPDADVVRGANDYARACAERSDGMAQWLAYVNPQNADWREELDRCAEMGAIGVKLWVSLKDEHGSVSNTRAVVSYAGERDLPLLIHTFHRTGPNMPGELTLEEFADLAEACPGAAVIAAHAGANWRYSIGVLRDRAPNALVDVCGCFPQRGMVEALVRDVGADRIVFGSDATGRSISSQLAKVVFADVGEEEKDKILCGNAVRIFGSKLDPAPAPAPPPLRVASDLPDAREDHFCFCGRWPFFETPCVTPLELDGVLAEQGIARAFTGDLSSVFRIDIENANNTFMRAARDARRVAPLAVLNPLAHNWRRTIRYLGPDFAGAIVHPYLHNWDLADPSFAEFFAECARRKLPLWVNCALGDYRFRHPGLACRPVSAEELIAFGKAAPENSYVFQGLSGGDIRRLLDAFPDDRRFRFEISRLTDQSGVLEAVLSRYGKDRLVMGSEFPLRDIRTVRWTARR